MSRRYVTQFGHQEAVDEVFLASEKQLRPNRNGNLYLQVDLSDRSGVINARMWNATEAVYRSFNNGDYVRVEGSTQLFQGSMQLIATRLTKIDPREVNEEEFTSLPAAKINELLSRLRELVRKISDPGLRTLGECFLLDEALLEKLSRAPAGVRNHHAHHGGLLEHIINVMEVVLRIAPCYPMIDRDLLLTGAFVHDIGKVDELSYDRDLAYTDEGQLIGHLVMAVKMLDQKAAEAERLSGEPIDQETILRLKHMIVSHHGQYEFGSPKLPMTLEAVALAYLDNLDAKIQQFYQQLHDDPNVDSSWTAYNANLGRKLFKGRGGRRQQSSPAAGDAPETSL